MSKTVVGLFSTVAQAEQVKQSLISSGYTTEKITVVANGGEPETAGTNTGSAAEGIGEKIGHFFKSLTGGDEDVHNHYATGVNQGGALLAITTEDSKANTVAALLKQHGARDIDGGSQQEASSGTPVYGGSASGSTATKTGSAATTTGETAIPIIEEELVVGKREVDRGGVRVYSHVTERPVSEDVTLRDEYINVERRPVNRAATAADFAAGSGSVIELKATGEEAVVGKTQRVVEEVLVGKQSSQHTEAIHDTVRKTEVDVEQIPGTSETTSSDSYGTTGTKTKTNY